jgi:peptidyl-prolyl cis-trans isomerase B (cyclophilin B)
MKRFLRVISFVLAILSLGLCVAACQNGDPTDFSSKAFYNYNTSSTGKGTNIKSMYVEREIDSMKVEDFVASDKESDFVLIKIKDYGSIVVLLRHDVAPVSVANFKKLVSEKFYDGTVFHRVIEHFMIQGGGYIIETETNEDGVENSKLVEKESESIFGEFESNGFENNLLHVRGVLSMARTSVKNSASSQFFIIHETNESSASLNGNYAAFGYVLAGMNVVDAIATCEVKDANTNAPSPVEDVIIESATFVEPKEKLW